MTSRWKPCSPISYSCEACSSSGLSPMSRETGQVPSTGQKRGRGDRSANGRKPHHASPNGTSGQQRETALVRFMRPMKYFRVRRNQDTNRQLVFSPWSIRHLPAIPTQPYIKLV
jgi:hypothetical protein